MTAPSEVRRYSIYNPGRYLVDPHEDYVLASDFDAQVDAGIKLVEQNEKLRAEVERMVKLEAAIHDARLEWAMVCECPCAACDKFYEAIRDARRDRHARAR